MANSITALSVAALIIANIIQNKKRRNWRNKLKTAVLNRFYTNITLKRTYRSGDTMKNLENIKSIKTNNKNEKEFNKRMF